ncbi:unnamed protein product [Ostreobium quekettii]|uniref:Nucleolar protein 12 n=1 Tax=Ostreobium quekettii TaxID=121088 RepID=A0A8S1IPJ0_9CHLO|nr:unnamed protein product [Ostreobium quekettii]|eukprot:evm.model.scf_7.8 EVM.evm.TU.scf_7.8   scf_7:50399-55010(-)
MRTAWRLGGCVQRGGGLALMRAVYEFDALAFSRDAAAEDAVPVNYVKKRKAKSKGAEAVFDPEALKDYVTGFRRRKQQRRQEAKDVAASKDLEARRALRAEKRQHLKERMGIGAGEGWVTSSSESEEDDNTEVVVYNVGDATTTVTTAPLKLHDDSDGDCDDDEDPKSGNPEGQRVNSGLGSNETRKVGDKRATGALPQRRRGAGGKKARAVRRRNSKMPTRRFKTRKHEGKKKRR